MERLFCQTGSRPAAVGLGENLVELRVAAKPCGKDCLRKRLLFGLTILGPKARQAQGISIAAEGRSDLPTKSAAQVSFADATVPGQLSQVVFPFAFAQ